ncbi:O-antigen ligase family protein [Salinibacterium sp. NG253]|uniref:O-antigen ligase family protein n=1 Tax=Salinibacterium sp. NG253 TaxID=2792039 RepID=UPI0018CF9E9D|nr:O-antigen ligase family protein [Salinibacterium sp. NG253]MBH0117533.1 O-antigen ligase family protein [Salinibacterium sp. NG253]
MKAPRSPAMPSSRLGSAALWVAFIAVVVLLPDGLNRWVFPKEAALALAALLASLAPATGRLPRWFLIAVGAGAIVLASAALLSAVPLPQLWGRAPRFEGLVSLPVYFAAAWIGARLLGPRSSHQAPLVALRAAATIAIAIAVVALLEASGARPISTSFERPGSLLGNATDQGIAGAMLFAFLSLPALRAWFPDRIIRVGKGKPALAVHVSWEYRLLLATGVGAAITAVLLSASRGALLALFAALIVVAGFELRRSARVVELSGRKILRLWFIAAGIAAGMLAIALAIPLTRARLLGASSTIDDRILIWKESLTLFAQTPFLGLGPSGYVDAIGQSHGPQWFEQVESGATLDSPHNWILQAVSAGGVLFLVLALTIVLAVGVVGVRKWFVTLNEALESPRWAPQILGKSDLAAAALALCAAWAVGLLTHFTSPSTSILGCVVVGMLIARAPTTDESARAPTTDESARAPTTDESARAALARVARTVIIGLWASWLIISCVAEVPLQQAVNHAVAGEVATANSKFETAMALRPWDTSIASTAAQYLAVAADNRVDGAALLTVGWAERALADTPDSVATLKAYAVGLRAADRPEDAQEVYERLLSMRPNDAEVMLGRASTFYRAGDAPAALEWAQRASRQNPNDETITTFLEFLEQLPAEE